MKSLFEKLFPGNFLEFQEIIKQNLKQEKKMFIVTANPETFMMATKENEVKEILTDPNVTLVADGIGIVKGAHMLGIHIQERIPGVDITSYLLEEGNRLKKTLCFLGSSEEVKEKMEQKIKTEYPNLKLAKAFHGYGKDKDQEFVEIQKANPDIILVALGVPHQEKLIYRHIQTFSKGIFVGIGGSLDVISGTKKRAPKIFQKLGLEWLYRLIKEPKRIKRFYQNNVKFIFKLKKEKRK